MLPLLIASNRADDGLAPRSGPGFLVQLRVRDALRRHVGGDPNRLLLARREHHRDRLADVADHVDGEERLVEAHALIVDAAVLDVLVRDEVDERARVAAQVLAQRRRRHALVAARDDEAVGGERAPALHERAVGRQRRRRELVRVVELARRLIHRGDLDVGLRDRRLERLWLVAAACRRSPASGPT